MNSLLIVGLLLLLSEGPTKSEAYVDRINFPTIRLVFKRTKLNRLLQSQLDAYKRNDAKYNRLDKMIAEKTAKAYDEWYAKAYAEGFSEENAHALASKYAEGFAEGFAEGYAEGSAICLVAKYLLKSGVPATDIIKYTDINPNE